jgi:transposase, IS5 family
MPGELHHCWGRQRRVLPDTPEGRLDDLVETAKAHIRAKVEHPFRVIKQQFGFQKTRLRGMLKNRCKVNVLVALSNLFMARRRLLCST